MLKLRSGIILWAFALSLPFCGCSKDPVINKYKTKNVVLIVVDGPRYSETWGFPGQVYIPKRSLLLQEGVMCSSFKNSGVTSTTPGHTAMCTGVYQNIHNGGGEYPANPSIFQYWLKTNDGRPTHAWVIASKDKLAVLSDCTDGAWQGTFRPSVDCGNAGLATGYREDSTTFKNVKTVLSSYHPRLMIVNFKEPDASAHAGDSTGYLQGIYDTDNYIFQIWEKLQSDGFYKDQTTLIVSNDHGRHTAGHIDGYQSHGDDCDGCRHIEFFAIGPDFKKGFTSTTAYEQIDIANTIAELMGFQMPSSDGKVMKDIFH